MPYTVNLFHNVLLEPFILSLLYGIDNYFYMRKIAVDLDLQQSKGGYCKDEWNRAYFLEVIFTLFSKVQNRYLKQAHFGTRSKRENFESCELRTDFLSRKNGESPI